MRADDVILFEVVMIDKEAHSADGCQEFSWTCWVEDTLRHVKIMQVSLEHKSLELRGEVKAGRINCGVFSREI